LGAWVVFSAAVAGTPASVSPTCFTRGRGRKTRQSWLPLCALHVKRDEYRRLLWSQYQGQGV